MRPRRSAFVILAMVVSTLGAPNARAADPADLVVGVSEIVSGGAPGPVHPMSGAWSAVAAGDDDASFPSLYAAAREFGLGRVVILGHEGLLGNTGVADNDAFLANTLNWLDSSGAGQVRYSSGHSEWLGAGNLSGLATIAASNGLTMSALGAPLGAASLSGASVLIVGNAWGAFTAAEIDAVRVWVQGGGGLLLTGLGWSWPNDIEDYPMMQLAAPYEVRWLRGYITDPTNQVGGSTAFHVFYPDITVATVADAIAFIDAAHALHGAGIAAAIEADPAFRVEFVQAHGILKIPTTAFPADHPQRQTVFDAYTSFAANHAAYYARGFSFNQAAHPTSAHLRESAWRTWRDAVELTPARKTTMATVGLLTGRRLEVFDDFDLVLQDNDRLLGPELDLIHETLSLTPQPLYDLWSISVRDYLGTAPLDINLGGIPYGVNVFGIAIGQSTENPFPSDVAPQVKDVFYSVVAHELNHVVDATTIGGSPALSARRDQLIADAGPEPLNYLRSMISPGFFVNAPQEFFASISNQWFNDSILTIELGLTRFDNVRPDPVNQALFFADVYSQGTRSTLLYTADASGNPRTTLAGLDRNPQGWITAIEYDTTRHDFTVDAAGRVLDYTTSTVCVGDANGDTTVDIDDVIAVILSWGPCPPGCAADTDHNGASDIDDVVNVILRFGPCP